MKRNRTLIAAVALALAGCASPACAQMNCVEEYTLLTLAGPVEAPGASDGHGPDARFSLPTVNFGFFGYFYCIWAQLAVDDSGNVYVADAGNHTVRRITASGEVTTLAGLAGEAGCTDGIGSKARFGNPAGVAVDRAGNVYVAEYWYCTVRKITPAGAVTTLAGAVGECGSADGRGSAARFNSPAGLAVDKAGNVYVAESGNATIRKISPEGNVTTLAGKAGEVGSADGPGDAARFGGPEGVAVSDSGEVFVADTPNHTIRKISAAGAVTTVAGLAGDTGNADGLGSAARFYAPGGIALDSSGNLYVADIENSTVRKITPTGVVTTLAGQAGQAGSADGTGSEARFTWPYGVAVDQAGSVYVTDGWNSTIRRISPDGAVTTLAGQASGRGSADGIGAAGRFDAPSGPAVDSSGNLYLADCGNATIRKIGPTGRVTTVAGMAGLSGSTDGMASTARFSSPGGVAVDGAGNVYVADTDNSTIRTVRIDGIVTTLAGLARSSGSIDGPGSIARFSFPQDVAADSAGNVYVADTGNATIRKISPSGEVTTLAGLAGALGDADGSGNAARFQYPVGIAVDGVGNVYVADAANFTIRKISPAGEVTTLAGRAGESGLVDGIGSVARFSRIMDLAVDAAGNVYVADYVYIADCSIRKISPARVVTTVARSSFSWLWMGGGTGEGTGNCGLGIPSGVAVDSAGTFYVTDSWNNNVRVGFKACADRPVADPPLAPVGVMRQLDITPQTATAWWWSWLRRPAASKAELSSTTARNPTFTPDVPDLYVLRLLATNQMTGEVSLRTLELNAIGAAAVLLSAPRRLPNSSVQMALIGQPNQTYTLQVSGDLHTWTDWTNVMTGKASTLVIDADAAHCARRFYRAIQQ